MSAYGETEEDNTATDEEDIDNTEANNQSSEDIKAVVEDMLTTSPIRGDKDARFTIVEYTELHCPYCQRHSQEGTINAVIEQFPGEVNSISKHFIIHGEDALNLAAAMECVSELKPEVYHETFDKAFEAYPVDMDGLVNIATEL
jgi:protein-disulfide isomerase